MLSADVLRRMVSADVLRRMLAADVLTGVLKDITHLTTAARICILFSSLLSLQVVEGP